MRAFLQIRTVLGRTFLETSIWQSPMLTLTVCSVEMKHLKCN